MALERALRLLDSQGATASVTGELQQIISRKRARRFLGRLVATNNSGTLPTLDVVIQAKAPDESTWQTIVTFDQVTTGTDDQELVPISNVQAHWEFRAVATLAGTLPDYDFSVDFWYGPSFIFVGQSEMEPATLAFGGLNDSTWTSVLSDMRNLRKIRYVNSTNKPVLFTWDDGVNIGYIDPDYSFAESFLTDGLLLSGTLKMKYDSGQAATAGVIRVQGWRIAH